MGGQPAAAPPAVRRETCPCGGGHPRHHLGLFRDRFEPATKIIESTGFGDNSKYLGGLDLPILLAWCVGGILAALAAWVIARIALGLRSDYLAIATLGISEIVIAILKNEGWLTRGVLNVTGLPPPVPSAKALQGAPYSLATDASLIVNKLLFVAIVALFLGSSCGSHTAR